MRSQIKLKYNKTAVIDYAFYVTHLNSRLTSFESWFSRWLCIVRTCATVVLFLAFSLSVFRILGTARHRMCVCMIT